MSRQPAMGSVPAGTWRPTGRRVIIMPSQEYKRDGDLAVSQGGVVLPGSVVAGKPAISGVVLQAGPDCVIVHADDIVMYVAYQGATVKIGGREFIVMDEQDVLAVYEGAAEHVPLPQEATLPTHGPSTNGRKAARVRA